jgi:hypothetical protein
MFHATTLLRHDVGQLYAREIDGRFAIPRWWVVENPPLAVL